MASTPRRARRRSRRGWTTCTPRERRRLAVRKAGARAPALSCPPFANHDASLGVAREVLRGDLVEELLEAVDDLLGVLDLVLELDRRLGDDLLGGEDRGA